MVWLEQMGRLFRQPGFPGFLATTLTMGVAMSFVGPFLSLWGTKHVGFTPLQFGLLMTGSALNGIFLAFLLGRWSDTRWSRRTVLLLGSGSGVAGYAGLATATSPWVLFALAVTLVAAGSVCFSQLFATARDWFARDDGGAANAAVTLSVVRVSFSVAGAAGPPVAAAIVLRQGFSGLFFATAGLYALLFLGVALFVPGSLRSPARSAAAAVAPVGKTFWRPMVCGHFAVLTLIAAMFTLTVLNLPLAVTHHLNGTAQEVGLIFAVGPLVEIPLMLWFGQLAARGFGPWLMRIGGVASALYFVLLLVATEVWQLYAIQVLSGVSFAILTNVAIGVMQNLIPGQPGLATAIFASSGSLGRVIGYLSFGLLSPRLGTEGLFALSAVVASGAAVGLWGVSGKGKGGDARVAD